MSFSPKEIIRLPIFKNQREIGSLMRTERGYALEFKPEVVGEQITYHIKATAHPLIENGVNLPPYFANLLPEGLRLRAMVQSIKTSEDDLFSLFVASGEDSIGDITGFVGQKPKTSDGKIKAIKAIKLDQVNFYQLFDESLEHAPHESIAGVQEKISASMISFPVSLSKKKKQYLLKLNPKDKKNLVENEYQCLLLAEACGIKTAKANRVTDRDGNEGLLVERFDRIYNDEKNGFDFIHQEDGCQILNVYPSQKYLTSMNALAKQIAELVPSSSLEIFGLVKWVAFSYLVGNGDLHAKNISLQDLPGQTRRLTPAYDLISTCIYGDSKLALKIDGMDDNLSARLLIDFCGRFEIPAKAAKLMLDKLVLKFSKHGPELLKAIDMSEKEQGRLEKLMRKRIEDLS